MSVEADMRWTALYGGQRATVTVDAEEYARVVGERQLLLDALKRHLDDATILRMLARELGVPGESR